jgi:hypothetical protein
MNIHNRPVAQMDPKDQVIYNLSRENELLKMENAYLREQLKRVQQGLPIEAVEMTPTSKSKSFLPPIAPKKPTGPSAAGNPQPMSNTASSLNSQHQIPSGPVDVNRMIVEYQGELNRLAAENDNLRNARDVAEMNYQYVMNENNALQIKLANLENIFIGGPGGRSALPPPPPAAAASQNPQAILNENSELRKRIAFLEMQKQDYAQRLKELSVLPTSEPHSAKLRNTTPLVPADTVDPIQDLHQLSQLHQDLLKKVEKKETDYVQQKQVGQIIPQPSAPPPRSNGLPVKSP